MRLFVVITCLFLLPLQHLSAQEARTLRMKKSRSSRIKEGSKNGEKRSSSRKDTEHEAEETSSPHSAYAMIPKLNLTLPTDLTVFDVKKGFRAEGALHYARANSASTTESSTDNDELIVNYSGPMLGLLVDYTLDKPRLTFGLNWEKTLFSGNLTSTSRTTGTSGTSELTASASFTTETFSPHVFFTPVEVFYAGASYQISHSRTEYNSDTFESVRGITYSAPLLRIGTRYKWLYDLSLSYKFKASRATDEDPDDIEASEWFLSTRVDLTPAFQGKFTINGVNESERNYTKNGVEYNDHMNKISYVGGGLLKATPNITLEATVGYQPSAGTPAERAYSEHYSAYSFEPRGHFAMSPLQTVSGGFFYFKRSGSVTVKSQSLDAISEKKESEDYSAMSFSVYYTHQL